MTIKSSQNLVEEALKEINTISPEDALKKINDNKCNLIDIRDIRELQNSGKVENSIHIPRGMLEFWMDPNSAYFKEGKIDMDKELTRTGDTTIVTFRFSFHSEYLQIGSKIMFREGRTKGVGDIVEIFE